MTAFLNTIKKSIYHKAFSREYYQTVIASWSLSGFLTTEETADALAYLDTIIPE